MSDQSVADYRASEVIPADLDNDGDIDILLLTARSDIEDRVEGLRKGADDYLCKPFALDELLARVDALCRRGFGKHSSITHK